MLESPEALDKLLHRLSRASKLEEESVMLQAAVGRVLAQPILSDRDSPACDVSAVDGYAVRIAEATGAHLPVAFEVPAGSPAPFLPIGKAARVFTGAPVPDGTEAMVPREHCDESNRAALTIKKLPLQAGSNIRRRGENLPEGGLAVVGGRAIDPAVMACLASFGISQPRVHRRLRVAVLVTGDEVLGVDDKPAPWQLRDSNGPTLRAFLAQFPWVELATFARVADEPATLRHAIERALSDADALLLTGGVSAGDLDYVPSCLRDAGAEILFHKLSIRPGKPLLGAIGPAGQPILGLPGNPVAVMVTVRRFGLPALRARAGFGEAMPPATSVWIDGGDDKTLDLTWYRPVRLTGTGHAELVRWQGSGDAIGAARGDGFIEVPPGERAAGHRIYYGW